MNEVYGSQTIFGSLTIWVQVEDRVETKGEKTGANYRRVVVKRCQFLTREKAQEVMTKFAEDNPNLHRAGLYGEWAVKETVNA